MTSFYKRLSYSIGNEDWKTEQKALKITPLDRLLTVTASGDRPLNLLTSGCAEIVSVDANSIQNALFDLKKTALTHLDYDHYAGFIGISEADNRLSTFETLTPLLTPESAVYWKKNLSKIENGVIYQGFTEKWLCRFSPIIRFFRRDKIHRLFAFDNLEEQAEFVDKEWVCPTWKRALDAFLHPSFNRFFMKDPCLYEHIDPSLKLSDYIYTQMNSGLRRFLAKESILISLMLRGKISEEAYSPYLTKEGVETIKERIPRISFQTKDLLSYLEEAPSESFDCFSLSDVASYLSQKEFERLARSVYRVARPGARFCIRQFLSRHKLPADLQDKFQRDLPLEETLGNEDRCFLYNFTVGSIVK